MVKRPVYFFFKVDVESAVFVVSIVAIGSDVVDLSSFDVGREREKGCVESTSVVESLDDSSPPWSMSLLFL